MFIPLATSSAQSELIESLVSVANGKALADARQVAKRFGKNHRHVLRDVDRPVVRLSRP